MQQRKRGFTAHSHSNTYNFQLSFYPTNSTRECAYKLLPIKSEAKQFPFQSLLENYRRVKCKTASTKFHSSHSNTTKISFLSKYLNMYNKSTRNITQSIDSAKISSLISNTFISEQNHVNPYQPIFEYSPKIQMRRKRRANTTIFGQAQRATTAQVKTRNSKNRENKDKLNASEKTLLLEQLKELNERQTQIAKVHKDEANERMKILVVNIRNKIYEGSKLLKKVGTL